MIVNGKFNVFNDLILFFIEGDGIGLDIWVLVFCVLDVVVEKVYGGECKIYWKEVLVGEKVFKNIGEWLL